MSNKDSRLEKLLNRMDELMAEKIAEELKKDRKYVYVAGSFKNKEEIEKICTKLEKAGYNVVSFWWLSKVKEIKTERWDDWYKLDAVKHQFDANTTGATYCDIFILVFNPDGTRLQGALVELGIAYATRNINPKKIIAIGKPPSKSAMYCAIDKFYNNIDEFISDEGGDV